MNPFFRQIVPTILLGSAASLLVGCDDPSDPAPAVESVQILVADDTIVVGGSTVLFAVVRDDDGTPLSDVPVEWSSNAPNVAGVDGEGEVSALSPGTASITAEAAGATAVVELTVRATLDQLVVDPSSARLTVGTNSVPLSVARLTPSGLVPATWTATSDNPAVADVDGAGRIAGAAAGTAIITVTADDLSAQVPVEVLAAAGSDPFDGSALAGYTMHGDSATWNVESGQLTSTGVALNSVALRDGIEFADGWVEADMDHADDGGLVLRFVDEDNYYLLAIRDDQTNTPGGDRNLELYKKVDGMFVDLEFGNDVVWERGSSRTIRFEIEGTVLRAYVDGVLVRTLTDSQFTAGGIGMRHNSEYGFPVTVRYQELRWGTL